MPKIRSNADSVVRVIVNMCNTEKQTMYQIAFDPGMIGCGYSVWENGLWLKTGTLIPKGGDHLSKLQDLQEKLLELYTKLLQDKIAYVGRVIIEDWQKSTPQFRVAGMLKCAEGRGVVVAVSTRFCKNINFLNKSNAPKTEAQWLAMKHGVDGSEHALDAYHLGILGGFSRG